MIFFSLYFINPVFYSFTNFLLLAYAFLFFKFIPKLNLKLSAIFGTLFLYGFFQSFFFDVGFNHYKNLINLLGYLVIFSFACKLFGNKSNYDLAKYTFFLATFCALIIILFDLYFQLSSIFLNLKIQNLNHFYKIYNSYIEQSLIQKQTIAQLFTIGFFASFQLKKSFLKLIISVFLFYVVLGSRSCMIGILVALLARNMPYSRNVNWPFVCYIFFILTWLFLFSFVSDDKLIIFNFDVRFSYFNAAYLIFKENPILGVGLFNIADFMESRNNYFLNLFGDLHNFNDRFGTGFESGMLQFLIGAGILGTFWIYLIGIQHHLYIKANGWDWISLSFLSIFVSSAFEDNLLMPIFFLILSILISKKRSHA